MASTSTSGLLWPDCMSWIRAACGGGWHPCDSCSGPSVGWHLAGLNLGIDANILNHIRNTVGFDCITLNGVPPQPQTLYLNMPVPCAAWVLHVLFPAIGMNFETQANTVLAPMCCSYVPPHSRTTDSTLWRPSWRSSGICGSSRMHSVSFRWTPRRTLWTGRTTWTP